MNRSQSIAEATRRFIEADKKHAVARAKAETAKTALDRVSRNHAQFRAQSAAV